MPVPHRYLFSISSLVCALVASPAVSPGQSADRENVISPFTAGPLHNIVNEFEAFIEDNLLHHTPGLAMTIVDINGPEPSAYTKTWGVKTLGSEDPIDERTVFRLASVSKGFASATAGVLVNEGLLDWEDRLVDYLPELRLKDSRRQQQISVQNILGNSTGLLTHAYTNLVEDDVPYERIVGMLENVDFICNPGNCYSYQNVAYSLIGDILQRASGQPYQELVENRIFTPLQMYDASVTHEGLIGNGNTATPHQRRHGDLLLPTSVKPNYYSVAPAAGVNASIRDMENWLIALLGGRPDVLPPEILASMFSSHVRVNDRAFYRGQWQNVNTAAYGMGWRVFDYAGTQVVYHAGWVQGYHAEVVLLPAQGLGMAMLTNADAKAGLSASPHFVDLSLSLQRPLLAGAE